LNKEVGVDLNFHDKSIIADPFPAYELIRAEGRVVWNGLLRTWMVPGYHDNVALMMDWRTFSNTILQDPTFAAVSPGNTMLNTDPPEATRLRRMLEEPFRRRSLVALEPRVAEIVDACLGPFVEKLEGGGPVDFVDHCVRSIPTMVICEMMGVPASLREQVQMWTDDIVSGLGAARDPNGAEKFARAVAAGQAQNEMFLEQRECHRKAPTDDLLTVLANDPDLTEAEFLGACHLLLGGGNETTYKLVANAVVLLARYPDQRELLIDDRALVTPAIEEVLRFEGVPQAFPRVVTEDTVFAGAELSAGDQVVCLVIAANRDPARLDDPGRLDVRRSPNPHLAFAHGTHLCLGMNLARMEARLALQSLIERVPRWEVTDVDYGDSFHVRGPHHVMFARV
jgi:cytochrome P450